MTGKTGLVDYIIQNEKKWRGKFLVIDMEMEPRMVRNRVNIILQYPMQSIKVAEKQEK